MARSKFEEQPYSPARDEPAGDQLVGRVTVVTGGTRGIGAAISRCLAAHGATVAACYSANRERAEELQSELARTHNALSIYRGNVADPEDCQRIVGDVIENHGRLDVLVNNAGITADRLVAKMTEEDWRSVIDVQKDDIANMSARVAAIFGPQDMDQFPEAVAKPLRANGIVSVACVPLVGTKGLLGVITLGSKDKGAFNQDDLDLLSQIANQISLALDNALAYRRITFSCRRLEDERNYLQSEFQSQYNFEDIVGKSAAIKHVLEQASIVAPTDSTVLLVGESGTGKELVARAIHNLSLRRDRTFVRLNCAAVPSGLVESELFGHEKGAFTGALAQKRGRIELAHEGSLFLDEIGDFGLELQPKLLRVLQEREFERLGSNHIIKVDTRLIAATHRDLPGMVRKGEFRDDLFYRLNVFPIHIPPLRERKEDIPLLVHYFVATLSRKLRKSIRVIAPNVMTAITSFSWPGNIRELQNFIERSVILSHDETLAAPISELGDALVSRDVSANTLYGMEREMILNVLRAAGGKLSGSGGAAERLGLKRTTLQRKMERLGILKSDYA